MVVIVRCLLELKESLVGDSRLLVVAVVADTRSMSVSVLVFVTKGDSSLDIGRLLLQNYYNNNNNSTELSRIALSFSVLTDKLGGRGVLLFD